MYKVANCMPIIAQEQENNGPILEQFFVYYSSQVGTNLNQTVIENILIVISREVTKKITKTTYS